MSTSRSRRTADEPTTIAFNLPLPMDVVVTLTSAIGVLYPDALMDATGSRPNQITMQIPHDSRCRSRTAAAKIRAAKAHLEDEHEVLMRSFGPGNAMSADLPLYMADTLLAGARAAFAQNPDAPNYVVYSVYDQAASREYVITVAYRSGQTPHQLRVKAEAERDMALDALARLTVLAAENDAVSSEDIRAVLDSATSAGTPE